MGFKTSYRRFVERQGQRKGAILALAALFLIVILAFTALSVDVGFLTLTRTQMQAAADSAALAGAMELTSSSDPATVRANAAAAASSVAATFENGDRSSIALLPSRDIFFGKQTPTGNGQFTTTWGNNQTPYNVVKVKISRSMQNGADGKAVDDRVPLFFAPIMGSKTADIGVEAIASFQPRDMMVVLDFSASMNDDSCLGAIAKLGRTPVEDNLKKMWQEIGSPIYGELEFIPEYAVLDGEPGSATNPHHQVTYRRTAVDIVSTGLINKVVLKFTSGATQTYSGLSLDEATFTGTNTNNKAEIASVQIYSTISSTVLTTTTTGKGKKKKTVTVPKTVITSDSETFEFTPENIKEALGLTSVPYPFPAGSWDEYISVVQSGYGGIADAGYRDMYGYLTWMHYLQYYRPSYADTPVLWKTSEQPVTCLKDGVDLFMDELMATSASDNVGLSIYTHTNTTGAILEHGLSSNLSQIKTTTRQRQAGHYLGGTNISAGMKVARQELTNNSRARALKWMVLMTDGEANLPYSASYAKQCVHDEAKLAKDAGIKILTISVGLGADVGLMQSVASMTGGEYFQVRGDQSIEDVKADLLAVFRKIAANRPLKLLK